MFDLSMEDDMHYVQLFLGLTSPIWILAAVFGGVYLQTERERRFEDRQRLQAG